MMDCFVTGVYCRILPGLEKLRLKLVCGNGLRTTKTGYPSMQQCECYSVCGDIQDGSQRYVMYIP